MPWNSSSQIQQRRDSHGRRLLEYKTKTDVGVDVVQSKVFLALDAVPGEGTSPDVYQTLLLFEASCS